MEVKTEKNSCGIARFPCGSTVFLLKYAGYVSLFLYMNQWALTASQSVVKLVAYFGPSHFGVHVS